ncbi:NADH-quinone oxidoreductase subunit NuoH [Urbifossiella limnaea]|uniref:NADH-quinone oxidoreductase subunit H n=1 Tax=Urbifossiella limnaea TaxID=2528023 RepID=A0A517XLP8_9BACT|nr:NADH-quinone oxidoreductase subunit NuoH [Urbifossiella limnaea]QDU18430.1 NADH-quinone oxidoreductase subunit 8 [Urbifossiella limnaea]
MPQFDLVTALILIVAVMGGGLGLVAYLTLGERKVSAWIQDRVGPNRVGPFGLLQPLADGGKFFLKEEVIPAHVDRIFYVLAPAVGVITALLALAVVPVGGATPPPDPAPTVAAFDQAQADYRSKLNLVIAPGIDVGVLYVFALGSLAVYGVILAGWSANNKYSLLGAMRSSAQIISYEIPLGMAVLGVFLIVGSLNLERIAAWQETHTWWLVFFQPLAALLFMISAYAEGSRLPFDLPEAEQELVGGFHTEYSSMKLGLLLMTEFIHLITAGFMMSILFLGGWSLFGLENVSADPTVTAVLKAGILLTKMFLYCVFALIVRWTIPRFRFDQLMNLAWKVMIPLGLANVVCVVVALQFGAPLWVLTAASAGLFLVAGCIAVRAAGSITNPKRAVRKLPPGMPVGVTYAGR